jgi:2-oxoisovalerate dehydrogenase E1 component
MRELTFTDAAREGLSEEMARDPRVFVVGEGIGARGGNFNTTTGLFERHGAERLRDTPITERGFTGLCTGAAMTRTAGRRLHVLRLRADALGELLNQTSKIQYMSDGRLQMPIVLRGCVGVGHSAATHHSGSYYPIFTNIPGFRVAVPTTPADAKGLLKTAIRSDDPVVFMEHRSLLQTRGPVPDGEHLVPFGRAAVSRVGSDVTVVGITVMVRRALSASPCAHGRSATWPQPMMATCGG